jgi:hypothetical protein
MIIIIIIIIIAMRIRCTVMLQGAKDACSHTQNALLTGLLRAAAAAAAARFSVISGASVYFDAQDSAPGSPSGASPASSDHGDHHHPATAAAIGGSPLQYGSHAAPQTADGAGQLWGAGSVLSGSMSVGPQSRTRSQLSQHSGFTGITGHAGAGGAGAGSVDGGPGGLGLEEHDGAAGSVNGQVLLEGDGPAGDGKQPLCRCVIS